MRILVIMGMRAKIFQNKRNKQLTIILSMKKLKIKKKKIPKFIRMKKVLFEY